MLNILYNMDTEAISAFCFVFIDSLVVSASHEVGGHVISHQKKPLSCIWVAIPVDRVTLHLYACGADWWVGGWTIVWSSESGYK